MKKKNAHELLGDEDILIQGALSLGLTLSPPECAQIITYAEYLMFWNDVAGLTSYRKKADILVYMFLDSLAAVPLIGTIDHDRVLDMGTGGGFPGLPCRLLLPAMDLSLLDSSTKKTEFLNHLIRKLELSKTTVLCERNDRLPQFQKGSYRLILSRACASLKELATASAPLLQEGGRLLAWKGPRCGSEIDEARDVLEKEGLELEKSFHYTLPFVNRKGVIVSVKKPVSSK